MADGFDGVYVDNRRQLRGVSESLITGPQYRASGTIRLAVRPDGFTGVSIPIGASYPLNPAHDVDELTSHIDDFFERGRREISKP